MNSVDIEDIFSAIKIETLVYIFVQFFFTRGTGISNYTKLIL